MEIKELKITLEEANILVNLINIAVKATGLENAENALFFTKKLQTLFSEKKEEIKEN